ncbi:MAG: DUF502 domain-containing protein [Firmicutes bacterium]|nr:DUF502 domain-containing protein [Bacillota bacterium]
MHFIRSIRRHFLTGLLVVLPSMVTIYVLYFTFTLIDSFLGRLVPLYLGRNIPGLGFLVTIVFIYLIGLFASNVVGKKLLHLLETVVLQIPLVKPIYAAARQILDAFSAQRRQLFQSVAMVEYPRRGLYAIGFITAQGAGEVQVKTAQEVVPVFIPTTPNPTSGMMLLVPRTELIPLEMTVEEAIKMIISGGVMTPTWPKAEKHATIKKEA